MKASLAFAALVSLASLAPSARAEDTVRSCIASSTEGQTLRNGGKLLAARAAMLSCARDVCPAVVRSHCARWLAEIEATLPSIVVRAQAPGGEDSLTARVAIDGRPAKLDGRPVQLDPGEHVVTMDAPGSARVEERVLVVAGETARLITLRSPPPGASPPPPSGARPVVDASPPAPREAPAARSVPTGAWVLGGVGVAALAGSGVFALLANHDLSNLDATCSPHCSASQTSAGRTSATLTYVLLGTGAVAVSGAVVWAIAFPSRAAWPAVGVVPHLTLRPVAGGAVTSFGLTF